MQILDQRKEQLVFSHAACSYYKWVWLQVNFKGAIFAGRMKSAKTSKFKRLENKALYGSRAATTSIVVVVVVVASCCGLARFSMYSAGLHILIVSLTLCEL